MKLTLSLARWDLVLVILVVLLPNSSLKAAAPNPVITTAWPAGARAGSTVEVTLTGSGIEKQTQLRCSAPGLQTEFLGSDKSPRFRITIPRTTPPGLYEIRLAGPSGVSTPRTFQIGNRREVTEEEPNSTLPTSKPVPIDSIVNGRILEAGDQDCFRFTAKSGQRVVLECWAERIDSALHPVLQLFDSDGRLLKVSRGYFGVDPLIDFRVPADGDYIVRLHDLTYTGSANHIYRLDIDTGPRVAVAVPSVIRRGQSTRVTLYGWNLANRTKDKSPAMDSVEVEISAKDAVPGWPLPTGLAPSQIPFDAMAWQLPAAHAPVLIGITDVPVVTETIYREGRSRGSDSIAKIGGAAVGGAILGAIFGGGRGAAIGGSIGAAGGTAAALNNGEAEPAGLPPGTRLTVRLSRPVAVAGRAMTARRYRWNER